ncbi:MAG: 4-hydroxy-3-methylbut-2-enyl diphosphate reductase [Desulfarculaceae bacterium]
MRVRVARTAGFCMGVHRALALALETTHQNRGQVSTFGPLIHNPQVLDLLAEKGIQILNQVPSPGSRTGGTVIIRAHGVPPQQKRGLKEAGFSQVVDGTCPRVVRVQAIIRRVTRAGGHVVIVGDLEHPEVVGLLGHAEGGRGHVVSKVEQVADLPQLPGIELVAQTTQNEELFLRVARALKDRYPRVEVHNTICEATHNRQNEVKRLASEVEGVVVVGGRQSGNTRRLAELSRQEGAETFLVESETELDRNRLAGLGTVAVTAGASTPNWMIKKVTRELAAIRSSKEAGLSFWGRRVFRFMVRSQILVALGAAAMTIAASLLQDLPLNPTLLGVSLCYIYAMHILNQFLDTEAGQYNEPDRAQFLAKHKLFLIGSGVVSSLAAIVLCALLGKIPFILVAVMSILGLLYSVPVVPRGLERRFGINSLKDIPGSKTMSAALAWALIVALLPVVVYQKLEPWPTFLAFFFTGVMVFVRCAWFDILDVQGDLIVGKETIPIVLGEAKTRRLLWGLTAGLGVVLFLAPLLGMASFLAWVMLIPLAGLTAMQIGFTRRLFTPGAFSEGLIDANFWVAGITALIWWAW